jgi:aminoglycoside phosphotransferase
MKSDSEKYFLSWAEGLIGKIIKEEKDTHGEEGIVYKLENNKGNYFLKIKYDSTSTKECDKLKWFKGKIPVPDVVGFTIKDNSKALLLTALKGKNLAILCSEWPVEKVIEKLAEVLHAFHNTNTEGWPFDKSETRNILVHGDACLPNFIFNGDKFSGYIDLGASKLATPEVDLAAIIWSLQYNLGKGHGVKFLEKYGNKDVTEEMAENLRLQYEHIQKEHGYL